ncbi:hypothetical protein CAEBREN_17161 [Caenorhabditis brenneri]|uniref:SXP/RAL-2 family protein Ani s 5-like cation-binding domain-containing protein n=1 Tax=Caenorhabditis brenneri TaxID=135651 RepID=G0MC50_CAEBE|nr:hypothetical protein CAEBREN_17161 [Caenorhabditis brenneri]
MKKIFVILLLLCITTICETNKDEKQPSDMKPPGIEDLTDQSAYLEVLKDFSNKMEEETQGIRVARDEPGFFSSLWNTAKTAAVNAFDAAVNALKKDSEKISEAIRQRIENEIENRLTSILDQSPNCTSSEPAIMLTRETLPPFLDGVEQWVQMMNDKIEAGHPLTDEEYCSIGEYLENLGNIKPLDLALEERYLAAMESLAELIKKQKDMKRIPSLLFELLSDYPIYNAIAGAIVPAVLLVIHVFDFLSLSLPLSQILEFLGIQI